MQANPASSSARESSHTIGDNRSQLHYALAQFNVFGNVVLNTTDIGPQLLV